jgi:hypothetical protein
MKRLAMTLMSVSLLAPACSHANQGRAVSGSDASGMEAVRPRTDARPSTLTTSDVRMVAPALEKSVRTLLPGPESGYR